MPNARVLAAAGGLPTRRATLAGLAGLGAALALPKATHAAGAADAALIAQANKFAAFARRLDALCDRRCQLDGEAEAADPARPIAPSFAAQEPRIQRMGSGAILLRTPGASPLAAEHAKAHAAAVEAWEAECQAIRDRLGVPALDRRYDRLDARLQDEAAALADMVPATIEGAAAKARAAVAVSGESNAFADTWIARLQFAALRDVAAIGGKA